MGNDNKTVRSKILVWQFFVKTYGLFHITLVAPCWLSAQAVQERIENQLTNSYEKSVAYVHKKDLSYRSSHIWPDVITH